MRVEEIKCAPILTLERIEGIDWLMGLVYARKGEHYLAIASRLASWYGVSGEEFSLYLGDTRSEWSKDDSGRIFRDLK